MAGMKLKDDEESEEEERRKAAESFAERQAKALREREEKQRKYDEMREKLFGPSAPPAAPDESQGRSSPSSRQPRGKGRGRGGGSGGGNNNHSNASSADQSPARGPMPKKQLYDPSYSAKPNSIYIQKREQAESSSGPGTPTEQQPIRAPRGPDGSSGFAGRGRGRASGAPA
jgi:hypothetical protein